jgi:hypothetical protein
MRMKSINQLYLSFKSCHHYIELVQKKGIHECLVEYGFGHSIIISVIFLCNLFDAPLIRASPIELLKLSEYVFDRELHIN